MRKWKLIDSDTGEPISIGDNVKSKKTGEDFTIRWMEAPHKSSSTGKVHLEDKSGNMHYYYAGIIGAKFIIPQLN